jgi:hypothetical protein
MNKVKKVFNDIVAIIAACGVLAVAVAWVVSFLSLTFGLAIWSTQWMWGLI